MNNRLLTGEEHAEYLIEHDTAGFMRGDTKSRYEAYAIGIGNGIITRNEARIRENLNPIEGADELLQPLNMTTVGAGVQGKPQDEPNGKRAFTLTDVSDFMSDRRRRAVMGKRNAAEALGLKDEQVKALEKAFSRWLTKQAAAVKAIIADVFGKRANGAKAEEFDKAVDDYFDALMREAVPKDIGKAVSDVTETAIERIRKDVGSEAEGIDEAWMRGYMERYYNDMRERLLMANREAVKKAAGTAEPEEIDGLIKKLTSWGTERAANMAKIEAAMAVNEAMVAGYRKAGYTTVWASAPSCCKICTDMNGQTVTTLKPPLHKGCVCGVGKSIKMLKNGIMTSDGIKISPTNHMYDRIKERGIDTSDMEKALTSPLFIGIIKYDDEGRPSKQYIGEKVTVAINPDDGSITSVWPTKKRLRKKYKADG